MTGRLLLRSCGIERSGSDTYPFSVPAVRALNKIEFRAPVTYFSGENGSGKSTVLEAIALAVGSVPVRAQDVATECSLEAVRPLAMGMTLAWNERTHRGFFLRAEDFFEYKKDVARAISEYEKLLDETERRFSGPARLLARSPLEGERQALVNRYGQDLNRRSHGESFLDFFRARFTGRGLYLLDEPDTALSVQSLLGLVALIKDMVRDGAQFIIATHSPVLLALPGAAILSFDRVPPEWVAYEAMESVGLLRSFLEQPGVYLRHL